MPVTVEVDIAPGLPGLQLVGLADTAVQEARERVRAAIRNSGLKVPLTRVVVSLAPADLRKEGPWFDLPIALGLLVASGQLGPERVEGVWCTAELGLDGRLRPVRGVLAQALAAARSGARALVVAAENAPEAALVEGLTLWPARHLAEVLQVLEDPGRAAAVPGGASSAAAAPAAGEPADLAEVEGQWHGRRALEIAAAGQHHLLLVEPPGSGKTMLARRLAGLLPPLQREEALEVTQLHSVAGLLPGAAALLRQRPFRAPHHSCSAAALVGGGVLPRPGELSLAHQGVLFLDELTEFRRDVLELLRQPLEEGEVWISRSRLRCRFPCRTTLVGATNPCACGWFGDPERACSCGQGQRQRYWSRLSGPLLDRIDLQVVMRRPSPEALARCWRGSRGEGGPRAKGPESSRVVAGRVAAARERMRRRNPQGWPNGRVAGTALRELLAPTPAALDLWQAGTQGRRLSARSAERVLRVARTIADLAGEATVGDAAMAEALGYRSFDGLAP